MESTPLSLATLPLPKEKTYYQIALVVAIIFWILIVVSVVGIIYALLAALAIWLTHGLLIARLRSESILVEEQQYPELYATYLEVCQRLEVSPVPELYILQAGGVLNAYATRHAGRNFVVLYSSFLDACGPTSSQIKFLIGHELGHIQRRHLTKKMVLVPSLAVPLLGHAYYRACEATCDRFGAFAANEPEGAMRALLILGGGREAALRVEPARFALQHHSQRGFFVSWHELISNYPTLSQRVSNLIALEHPQYGQKTLRHPFAYVCAFLFTWRTLILLYIVFIILTALGAQVHPHPVPPAQP